MPDGCKLPTVLNDTGLAYTSDTTLRPAFYDSIDFDQTGLATDGAGGVICGSHVTGAPIDVVTQSLTGCKLGSFADLFYGRVVALPNPLDMGNLVADTDYTLGIFNAYFTEVDLNDVVLTNLPGISINSSTPVTLLPLQEIEYTVTALINEGPPSIGGEIFLDFEPGVTDITVEVIGNRVLPLPYLFQPGLSESLNWVTKVITSYNGAEQRIKLRKNPVQTFSGSIAIPNGEIAFLDALLYAWRANFFALPISSEARNLDSPTVAATASVLCNTDFGDFRAGGLAAIFDTPTNFEIFVIQSFTQSEIISTTNITKVYGVSSFVIPVRIARFTTSPTRRTSGHRQMLDFAMRVTDNRALAVSAAADQYKGLDVYLDQPLTIGPFAQDVYTARVDTVGFSSGIEDTFAPWIKTKIQRVFGLQFESLEDVWNHRLWLMRRQGKYLPFWMPTFEPNFKLLSVGAIGIQLIVVNKDQDLLSDGREDIAISTTSGWLFREVQSISPIGDDLEVVVDTSLGIDASEILFISWMGRKRMSSDTAEIAWTGNKTGTTSVPITEINN